MKTYLLPDTSRTCKALHCPTSIGRYCNLLSLKDNTPNFFKFPRKSEKIKSNYVLYLILKSIFLYIIYNYKIDFLIILPISIGKDCKLFLSTFKLFKLCRLPIDIGNSKRKFSVRISSCKFSHLKHIRCKDVFIYIDGSSFQRLM